MTIYLYVKTHRKTGLKYLGKTSSSDPHAYHGSGGIWKSHLTEFGIDYDTEIIRECQTNQELSEWGRYYSELWNVVESPDWANQIPETGGGGNHTPERKELFRQQQLGRKKPTRNPEHTEKQAATTRGRPNPKTAKGLRKWYDSNPDRSKIIQKQSESLKKWCKENPQLLTDRSLISWSIRYKKDYNKYKEVIRLIGIGKTNSEIRLTVKIDPATIKKLRSGYHRVFTLFPEFIKLLRP
jgi:hypothetical protein